MWHAPQVAVAIVAPFAGLLYDPSVAGPMQALTTPPYDQISAADQDRYRRASAIKHCSA